MELTEWWYASIGEIGAELRAGRATSVELTSGMFERIAGIRVNGITVFIYVVSGVLAGFAGVMLSHQLLAGAPSVGSNLGLQSITAVILGGASLAGGTGGIPGTLLGILVIGTVSNGLALMQVPTFYQQIATGAILLLAVGLGRARAWVERTIWSLTGPG